MISAPTCGGYPPALACHLPLRLLRSTPLHTCCFPLPHYPPACSATQLNTLGVRLPHCRLLLLRANTAVVGRCYWFCYATPHAAPPGSSRILCHITLWLISPGSPLTCRVTAFYPPHGRWTVGYGTTTIPFPRRFPRFSWLATCFAAVLHHTLPGCLPHADVNILPPLDHLDGTAHNICILPVRPPPAWTLHTWTVAPVAPLKTLPARHRWWRTTHLPSIPPTLAPTQPSTVRALHPTPSFLPQRVSCGTLTGDGWTCPWRSYHRFREFCYNSPRTTPGDNAQRHHELI